MQDSYQNHFKKGATTLCILAMLKDCEMYGYQLVQKIGDLSQGKFTLQEGTLYPVLYRLEQQGYLSTRKELVGKKMERVYYRLTSKGIDYYHKLLFEYNEISDGVQRIIAVSNPNKGETEDE